MKRATVWVTCSLLGALASIVHGQVGSKLDVKAPKWEFQNIAVPDVLAYLSEIHRQAAKTPFRIEWKGLGSERTSSISGAWPDVRLGTALDLVCRLANAANNGVGEMDWFVENGVVVVASRKEVGKRKTLRQYPGAPEAAVGLIGGFLEAELLAEDARAELRGSRLSVNGSPRIHEEVARLLTVCQKGMTPEDWGRLLGLVRALQRMPVVAKHEKVQADQWIVFLRELTQVWIVIDYASIERAGLNPRRPVSLDVENVPAEKVLGMVLAEIEKGGKQRLVVDSIGGELLLVTTAEAARRHLAVFDITPTVARKLNLPAGAAALERIKGLVDPSSDRPVGPQGGELALVGRSRILCRNTLPVLSALADLMEVQVPVPPAPRPPQPASRPAPGPAARPRAPSATPAASQAAGGP